MQDKVIIEHRPRLQACQFYIIIKNPDLDLKLNVLTNSIEIDSDEIHFKVKLDEIQLIPESLSSLTSQQNGLLFRIQTNSKSIHGSFKAEVLNKDYKSEQVQKYIPQIEVNTPVHVFCNCCLHRITLKHLIFDRILPLPSANFEVLDLFCHQDKPTHLNLTPKLKDCLYGSYFVLLNGDFLEKVDDVIHCQRCYSWLGIFKSNGIQLWNSTINITTEKPINKEDRSILDFISVVNEISDGKLGVCKIIMECKISTNLSQYLLLWIIEKDLKLLISVGEITNHILKEHTVMKVLYTFDNKNTDFVNSWKKDVYVHNIEVSKQMMSEGLKHLSDMMLYIPENFRVLNNMYVSYIGIIKNS